MNSEENSQQQLDIDRQRERHTLEIRRHLREEVINKRRNIVTPSPSDIEIEYSHNNMDQIEMKIKAFQRGPVSPTDINKFIGYLSSENLVEKLEGIISIRRLVSINSSENERISQQLISLNAITQIMRLSAYGQHSRLMVEATWALANIATSQHEQCLAIVSRGVIPLFIHHLRSNNESMIQQCAWGIANLASDCSQFRDMLLESGAMQPLINAYRTVKNKTIINTTVWAISTLCRSSPSPKPDLIKMATPIVASLIADENTPAESMMESCWSLYHLSLTKSNCRTMLQTPGFSKRIPMILDCSNNQIIMPLVRVIGSIFESQLDTTELIDNGILDVLYKLTKHARPQIRKEVCWCLSNLAACSYNEAVRIIQHQPLTQRLVAMLQENQTDTQVQIIWAFGNICSFQQQTVFAFVSHNNLLRKILELLRSTMEPRLQQACLKAIDHMLRLGQSFMQFGQNVFLKYFKNAGGTGVIQKLQESEVEKIYNMSYDIIERYFQVDKAI